MTELLTFSQAIEKAKKDNKDKKPYIFLGNGFSRAVSNKFSYQELFKEAKKSASYPELSATAKKFLSKRHKNDLEGIIKELHTSQTYIKKYGYDDKEIKKDIRLLMRILLETISKTHPDLPSTIEDTKYKNCEDFLGNFEGIYTINYDLLLCWVINNSKTLPTKFNDGFGNRSDNNQDFVEWQLGDDIKANLLYLHGAMHILDNGAKAKKLTFNRTNIPLKEQISSYLRKKEYPIFVSGGRSEDKLEQIMHHGYLSRCYRSLQSIKSCLFIFGFAFKENDQHLIKLLNNNKDLYVGLFGDEKLEENQKIISLLKEMNSGRENGLYFYDSSSAKVWG